MLFFELHFYFLQPNIRLYRPNAGLIYEQIYEHRGHLPDLLTGSWVKCQSLVKVLTRV